MGALRIPGDRRAWIRVAIFVLGLLALPTVVWFVFPVKRAPAMPLASARASAPIPVATTDSTWKPSAKRPPPKTPNVKEVKGMVVDLQARPVEGATVKCLDRDEIEAKTDAKGLFTLPAAAVGCAAIAEHPDLGRSMGRVLTASGPNRIEYVTPGGITGEVVDDAGKGVASFTLSVDHYVPAEGMASERPLEKKSFSDANGAFTWEGLPAGSYRLLATAPGRPAGRSDSIEVEVGRTTRGVKIVLKDGAKLSGKITDAASGKGIAGATISLLDGGTTEEATSAADGSYSLEGVPKANAFSISVVADGYRRRMVTLTGKGADLREDVQLTAGKGRLEYAGIGALLRPPVAVTGNVPSVISFLPGSPAEAAGMKTTDRILTIDGTDTKSLAFPEVLDRLRGPEGTIVRIRIQPESGSAREISVTRKVIVQ